ncbi:MAG TPA: DUF1993 domain-containing protein [Caulobacterales bacterium]|nr:DUF1993 domain-containing protein [Caulobacterales bacterium]
MGQVSIHAASVPMFVALMNNMNTWLEKAEAYATEKKFDVNVLASARLAPDMLSLAGQVDIATAWAKNCMYRLAGQTPPDYAASEPTIAALKARIARALDDVQSISAKDLEGSDSRIVNFNLGPDIKMSLSGSDYLFKLALPNFYFHVTTMYDILRHNGLMIGKQDFLMGAFEVPK